MKIDLRGFRLSGSCLRLRQTASSTRPYDTAPTHALPDMAPQYGKLELQDCEQELAFMYPYIRHWVDSRSLIGWFLWR